MTRAASRLLRVHMGSVTAVTIAVPQCCAARFNSSILVVETIDRPSKITEGGRGRNKNTRSNNSTSNFTTSLQHTRAQSIRLAIQTTTLDIFPSGYVQYVIRSNAVALRGAAYRLIIYRTICVPLVRFPLEWWPRAHAAYECVVCRRRTRQTIIKVVVVVTHTRRTRETKNES